MSRERKGLGSGPKEAECNPPVKGYIHEPVSFALSPSQAGKAYHLLLPCLQLPSSGGTHMEGHPGWARPFPGQPIPTAPSRSGGCVGVTVIPRQPQPLLCAAPAPLGKGRTHQFALCAPLPGFDHELQEINIQDTDII